jgi:hypothetical protein
MAYTDSAFCDNVQLLRIGQLRRVVAEAKGQFRNPKEGEAVGSHYQRSW